ncbi:MAG: esterase family protein [Candidatus Riflebacteria bacterium]|nr:esterase family protein [Candidatus Riflebacteria bacterium]
MKRTYLSIPSKAVGRPLEMLVFGHRGKPLLVFPSSSGRFFDFENFAMIETIGPFIHDGKVQVYCVDGLDHESWFANAHPADKARRANDYDWAITHDVVPFIIEDGHPGAGIAVTGVSFGAYHSANFFLRHPDLFDIALCMSGNYSISFAVGDFRNDDVFYNDPLMYLPGLQDPWYLDNLRRDLLIMCAGQGPWEEWNGEAAAVSAHLNAKNVPHLFDLWGPDVAHDWPWWKRMIVHFLGKLDRAGFLTNNGRLTRLDVTGFLNNYPHL